MPPSEGLKIRVWTTKLSDRDNNLKTCSGRQIRRYATSARSWLVDCPCHGSRVASVDNWREAMRQAQLHLTKNH